LAIEFVLDLVELVEHRRQAGLDRMLPQQVRAEGVNGAGEETLERTQRAAEVGAREHVGRAAQFLFERFLKASTQLGRGLARERYGGHVLDVADTRGHGA